MTEKEARKKWCPFVRIETDDREREPVAGNRDCKGKWMGGCIASECMAWRWSMNQAGINYGGGQLPTDGYCGLAGADK